MTAAADSDVRFRGREIVGVVGVDRRAIARLTGKPQKKIVQVLERRSDRRGAQRLALGVQRLGQTSAERAHLRDMKFPKRLEVGRRFEGLDGPQRGADRRHLFAVRGLQMKGVFAFHALAFRAVF